MLPSILLLAGEAIHSRRNRRGLVEAPDCQAGQKNNGVQLLTPAGSGKAGYLAIGESPAGDKVYALGRP